MQPDPTKWTESLPLVLLGIRTALKDYLQCSVAELVYGTTLRLTGEFFNSNTSLSLADPASYVTQLKAAMSKLRANPPHQQQPRHVHIHNKLSTCTHVFIRQDAVCKPLLQPYNGPYRIVKCADKHFTLQVGGRQEVVALDQLKPANLDACPTLSDYDHCYQTILPILTQLLVSRRH